MKLVKAFGAFWYDFVIGDDWKIALYTVVNLAVVALLMLGTDLADGVLVAVGTVLMGAAFTAGVTHDARKSG